MLRNNRGHIGVTDKTSNTTTLVIAMIHAPIKTRFAKPWSPSSNLGVASKDGEVCISGKDYNQRRENKTCRGESPNVPACFL